MKVYENLDKIVILPTPTITIIDYRYNYLEIKITENKM
jgi:hypothetical protein